MKITNKTYVECPNCGIAGGNMDEIHQLFGYYIRHNQMIPNVLCKDCQISQKIIVDTGDKRPVKFVEWGNIAFWSKNVNLKMEQFLACLEEMGYIEVDDYDSHGKKLYKVTDLGREHCKLPFDGDNLLLWDYDTFSNIVQMKVRQKIAQE